ncbi:hypothetical protein [Sphaerotilus microaerophilus]|jgi:hypothetical protein|uniref:Uncharacterized protein n=1 Tax=Sphaerotilus microaerophilus TaxID=2914710 RepID=A0ABM7YHJ2_9BURK|nr:hypothetical protein [Sphaerotilus sp. FB-5]BDI03782.1 hypothetical protein CATMQ487_07520 [Sphaerotilus sp. FB-5]
MNAHLNANRRNDRAFAATLAAMATALCLLPLAGEFGRSASGANPAPGAATQAVAQAGVTVLEPVVITSQRAARQARLAQDDRPATPKI